MKKRLAAKRHRPTYFKGEADKEFNLESMRKYVRQKQEIDKLLEKLITPYLSKGSPAVLDAACGIGHLIYHFAPQFPRAQFTGIDETPYLIEEGKKITAGMKNTRFFIDDLYTLDAKYPKAFDISVCWKTLSWIPAYEDAMRALVGATKSHIFVNSLFYEGEIDYEIKVREYMKEAGAQDFNAYFNIYSLPRFKRFVQSLGAKKINEYDFDIGIDLPRGNIDHVGTYTIKLEGGKRMQMSGAVPMPWKILHIQL